MFFFSADNLWKAYVRTFCPSSPKVIESLDTFIALLRHARATFYQITRVPSWIPTFYLPSFPSFAVLGATAVGWKYRNTLLTRHLSLSPVKLRSQLKGETSTVSWIVRFAASYGWKLSSRSLSLNLILKVASDAFCILFQRRNECL